MLQGCYNAAQPLQDQIALRDAYHIAQCAITDLRRIKQSMLLVKAYGSQKAHFHKEGKNC